jgi:hypothetical protein
MRRVILAGLVLALSAPAADAGFRKRRAGQCGPAVAFPAAAPVAAVAVSSCPGGVCPVPSVRR